MLSNVHFAEGDMDEAVAVAREAQALLNDIGAFKEEAHALRVVAEVHAANKDFDAALHASVKERGSMSAVLDRPASVGTACRHGSHIWRPLTHIHVGPPHHFLPSTSPTNPCSPTVRHTQSRSIHPGSEQSSSKHQHLGTTS